MGYPQDICLVWVTKGSSLGSVGQWCWYSAAGRRGLQIGTLQRTDNHGEEVRWWCYRSPTALTDSGENS